jgi:hypothetical protein
MWGASTEGQERLRHFSICPFSHKKLNNNSRSQDGIMGFATTQIHEVFKEMGQKLTNM